jgi:uncharacterized protein
MADDAKLERLEAWCRAAGALAVAFSGGLDSRFLCYTAKRAGVAVRALHVSGAHIPRRETEEARQWAADHGIPFTRIAADPLQNPAIRANGPDRCYHCKRAAFTLLRAATREGEPLCDGTNVSDGSGYRPGLRALRELGIRSPLAEAGLDKGDIRSFARRTGMDRPEQAARPCLFTRYEYGLEPTAGGLAALDAAECRIEAFLCPDGGEGPPFRLRLTGAGPALHIRTAALTEERRAALARLLAESGFAGAAVETVEQISGYFDRQRNFAASGLEPRP